MYHRIIFPEWLNEYPSCVQRNTNEEASRRAGRHRREEAHSGRNFKLAQLGHTHRAGELKLWQNSETWYS